MKLRNGVSSVLRGLLCSLALVSGSRASEDGGDPATRDRPASAGGKIYSYSDGSGLRVLTTEGTADFPVSEKTTLSLRALVDRIVAVSGGSSGGGAGHDHDAGGDPDSAFSEIPDAVTSASVVVSGGTRLDKSRVEATVGAQLDEVLEERPSALQLEATTSQEQDYRSYSAKARMSAEFFERNTVVSGFLGGGYDTINPLVVPPGESALWPASHGRVLGGMSVSQLLSPSLVLSGGVGITRQAGELSNPYRRAMVVTTLFPERLPSSRIRFTGFGAISWYLGAEWAMHFRQGFYADDWGVKALIPELKFNKELSDSVLLSLRYSYYLQSKASFYETQYSSLLPIRSGDTRLATIREHYPGVDLQWVVHGKRNDFGSVTVNASYSVSFIRHLQVSPEFGNAHVFSLGISKNY